MSKDNAKTDESIGSPNDSLANDYDNWQYYLSQIILLSDRLDICFIDV